MSAHPLDRPVWGMLNGRQAHLAVASGPVVRLDPAFGPFAAARDSSDEALAALGELVRDGEVWLVETEQSPAPPGCRIARVAPLVQMVATKPAPVVPGDDAAVLLGDDDGDAMTALALATEPGPWGEQTRRFGSFYGLRDGQRLMAMAGERMQSAPGFDEVSGVCTWPEFQGRGFAARLIRRVMAGMTQRGSTPFLHSYARNAHAIRLYESLGFRVRREMVATILVKA